MRSSRLQAYRAGAVSRAAPRPRLPAHQRADRGAAVAARPPPMRSRCSHRELRTMRLPVGAAPRPRTQAAVARQGQELERAGSDSPAVVSTQRTVAGPLQDTPLGADGRVHCQLWQAGALAARAVSAPHGQAGLDGSAQVVPPLSLVVASCAACRVAIALASMRPRLSCSTRSRLAAAFASCTARLCHQLACTATPRACASSCVRTDVG